MNYIITESLSKLPEGTILHLIGYLYDVEGRQNEIESTQLQRAKTIDRAFSILERELSMKYPEVQTGEVELVFNVYDQDDEFYFSGVLDNEYGDMTFYETEIKFGQRNWKH